MGEMLSEIPKATKDNNPSGLKKDEATQNQPDLNLGKPKGETLADMGITRNAASQYQQMAAHPELVEQAIAEARENDDIVSRSAVLRNRPQGLNCANLCQYNRVENTLSCKWPLITSFLFLSVIFITILVLQIYIPYYLDIGHLRIYEGRLNTWLV